MNAQKPFVIGLAGGSGSGKTTLARILAESLPWEVMVVGLDQFYRHLGDLPLEQRKLTNFDHPDSLDFAAFEQVARDLAAGREASVPVYDFAECNPTGECVIVKPTPIILLEGMQVLWHEPLLQHLDMGIFLNIDEPTRLERKLERDIRERGRSYADVMDMWETRTKPMHTLYVQPGRMNADLIFTDSFGPQVLQVVTDEIVRRLNIREGDIDAVL
jgi:uridine kinase